MTQGTPSSHSNLVVIGPGSTCNFHANVLMIGWPGMPVHVQRNMGFHTEIEQLAILF
jgi:hypothetical protein